MAPNVAGAERNDAPEEWVTGSIPVTPAKNCFAETGFLLCAVLLVWSKNQLLLTTY